MTLTQLTGHSRRVMVGCRTYTTTNTATVEASLVQKLKYKYRSEQGLNSQILQILRKNGLQFQNL